MKRRISIFTLLLCASAAFASGDAMRLSPVGYRLGATGDIAAYDPSVVTVTPGDTSIVTTNKPITLTAALNRDYKVVRWQKFDDDPTIRSDADPIEEFGEGSETVSINFATNVTWMYVTVVVKYDPTRTVKAELSSFGKGSVTVSPEKETYLKGDVVTLTAEPADGYSFVRWSDGNADHVRQLTVDGDIELKAYVEPNANRVSFSADEGVVLDMTEKTVRFGCAYGELPVPVREGLVFVGWKDEFGTMITSESTSDRAGDHALTAVWEIPPEAYIVVFDANGGTGLQTRVEQKFEVGVSQKLRVNTFYNPGHVFVGWNQNADAEEKQYFDEQIVQDLAPADATLTLFAVWRAEKVAYTVHFERNADDATGEMIDQQFAGGEEKPLSGCNFRRTGWTFLGWSTDDGAIEATYQDREKVQDLTTQKELTLYAVWTKNPVYYVNYMAMGRDSEPWKSEIVEQGKEYVLSATNGLARTGYAFVGWTNGTAKATYPAGKKCTTQELEKMVDDGDTITVVALWKPITYTLKFDGNGGYVDSEVLPDYTLTYDIPTTIKYKPDAVLRQGYEFQFWSADPKETNTVYRWGKGDEPVVTNLTTVAGDTVVWYAIWKGTNVTVKIDGQSIPLECGSQLEKPDDPAPKPGYTFTGEWHTNNNVTVAFPITVIGSFNLDPNWTTNTYTVRFNGNGGTNETGKSTYEQAFAYDEEKALTGNAFTRTGYAFANWTNAVGRTFADGEEVKNLTTNDGVVVDLYAAWDDRRSYTVRFNPNGGEGNPYFQVISCGKATPLTLNRFARTGYGFANWTNATGTVYTDGVKVQDLVAEGKTNDLYAVWTPNRYWVKFNGNGADGGKAMDDQEFTYDVARALTSNAFTRTGYGFANWTNSVGEVFNNGALVKNLTTTPDKTVTLYAVWEKLGDPLRVALGLGAEFDGRVSVSAEGAWTVIGEAAGKLGLRRASTSPTGQLLVSIPSAGTLEITFDAGGSVENGLTYSDGSHSAMKKSTGSYPIKVESACTLTFTGTPDLGCSWTLKNFTWTAK